jgi:hypothetical protein
MSNRREPLFDVHPATGASIEVFYTDRTLDTFGRIGSGWFWHQRRRGLAPNGPAVGPFPTSFAAYRSAVNSVGEFGRTAPRESHAKTSPCFHIASTQASRGSNMLLVVENTIHFNRLLARPERFERPTLRFVV